MMSAHAYKIEKNNEDDSDDDALSNIVQSFDVIKSNDSVNLIDYPWNQRLLRVFRVACFFQYQLACLSTLGGAYHFCNRPRGALTFAQRQETVGKYLGSESIIIRAKVYQAVNYALLGQSKKSERILKECKEKAVVSGMQNLCTAAETWIFNNIKQINKSVK